MQYLALARHSADNCPSASAKVRDQVGQLPGKMEELERKHKVNLQSAHILAPSHLSVFIFEAPGIEAVRDFVQDAGMSQWNDIEVYPSQSLQEAMQELGSLPPPIW